MEGGGGRPLLDRYQTSARDAADRWWVVLCKSAKDGRQVIEDVERRRISAATNLAKGEDCFSGPASALGCVLAFGEEQEG